MAEFVIVKNDIAGRAYATSGRCCKSVMKIFCKDGLGFALGFLPYFEFFNLSSDAAFVNRNSTTLFDFKLVIRIKTI